MKEMKNGTFTYKDESYNFDFKTSLSAYEKLSFVETVVGTLVSDNNYNAIIKDLIFDFAIIEVFTNIDTSFIYIKDDDGNDINSIIPIEHFLKETEVVNIVKANMDAGLLDELNHAVDLDIQYLTGIRPNPIVESLANLISTLEKKIDKVDLDNMMGMAQKFANMTEDFTLENVVNTYINSDIHKRNLAEISESKKQKAEFAEDMDKAIKLVTKENKTAKTAKK
jgi:hypothetical protein